MSRKYLNGRYCVRCNRCGPTPYLRDNVAILTKGFSRYPYDGAAVVDIGCGNGRNSRFMAEVPGVKFMAALDMAGDYGTKTVLGVGKMPVPDGSADIVLCNYLLMFLSPKERNQALCEIERIAKPGCRIVVELYPAKDSYAKTEADMLRMQKDIFRKLGWGKIRYSKGRFIAQKGLLV